MKKMHVPAELTSIGQDLSMTKADYTDVLRQIYQNEYYTNHGPLAKEFERSLESYLDIDNVVAIGNESLALLIVLAGLEASGDVILPAFGSRLVASILPWLNLNVKYCDVEYETHQPSLNTLNSLLSDQPQTVVLIETWGNRCDQQLVAELADRGVHVVIVAFDSFSSVADNRRVSELENVVTVFSFGPGQILSTLQGGAIAVHNNDLAHKFRNIRSSYGVRTAVNVKATCNGRFSEFQAGVGLKNMSYVQDLVLHFERIANSYIEVLENCPGISIYKHCFTQTVNRQFFPVLVTEEFSTDRDALQRELHSFEIEPIRFELPPGLFPMADRIQSQLLQLPINSKLTSERATHIAQLICRLGQPNESMP